MTEEIKLSPRECEILHLISLGIPLKAIAPKLFLSLGSVRNYANSARKKLGARSSAQAVRTAIEKGVLDIIIGSDLLK